MENYRRRVFMKMMKLKDIFKLVDNKRLKLKDAALLSNYSYWHFVRLHRRYRQEGITSLFKLERKQRQGRLTKNQVKILLDTYAELEKPSINLLRYFIMLDHPDFPHLSIEGLRKILIRYGVYDPGARKKKFRKRFEMPMPGLLVQADETGIRINDEANQKHHLVMFIDDHSRFCLGAKLVEHDTVEVHLDLHKRMVRKYGIYRALYYDNDEKYSYIRHNKSLYKTYHEQEANLQVRRALKELGIEVINSTPFEPQGKGKIERALGTIQNFYATFSKRYLVRNLADANRLLKAVIDYYNHKHINREIKITPYARFGSKERYFKKPPTMRELNRIFAIADERRVANDNMINFKNRVYQLRSKHYVSYAGKKVNLQYFPGRF